MWTYLLKRAGLAIVIVVTAVTLLYCMILAVPGDPANVILGPRATPEMKASLRIQMGLDRPVFIQISGFLINVFKGDLGVDVFSNRPVAKIIMEQLPYSILLILGGIGWAILVGVPLGCYSAIYRNSLIDKITGILSVGSIAIPSFVIAPYAVLIFAVQLKWLPAIGPGTEGDFISQLRHLIMPAFAIGLGWVGYLARIVRASMLEVLSENHIRTVRAFGLPERSIIFRYALKLGILPTIALLGASIGYLLSSAVFVEIIFARPGIGKLIFDSVLTRNYPIVMGSVLITTVIFVVCTVVADVVNAIIDPRIRGDL
jgi:peptide/nickel transport system permease protein